MKSMMSHSPPERNSPRTIPRKSVRNLIYSLSPPYRRMMDFKNHPMSMENHNWIMGQLQPIAYPMGWNGHQKNWARIKVIRIMNAAPKPINDNHTALGL